MSEARILSELTETKNELQRLKERMSIGTPTVHKDFSLISLVPKWSRLDSGVTLQDFFASTETSAKLGRWLENDQREIAVMRLAGSAKLFYQGCAELHEETTWQMFKDAFRCRYKYTHTDQYHFTKLQTARQARNESPQEFADRCRSLAQKVMGKSDDPQIQRVHREKTRPSVRSTRVRPEAKPHRKIPDGKLRIREMGSRRKRGQLSSPRIATTENAVVAKAVPMLLDRSTSSQTIDIEGIRRHSGYGLKRVHIETRRVE